MGAIKVEAYACQCDRCKELYSNWDFTPFYDTAREAEDAALYDEWKEKDGKYYCPNCYTVDEDTDEIIVKPTTTIDRCTEY